MRRVSVTAVVEGKPDEAVAERVVRWVDLDLRAVHKPIVNNQEEYPGKSYIDKNIRAFNREAHRAPWFVLRDWDISDGAACAPELVRRKLPRPARMMCFRIAVRSIESWLLADRAGVARFLGVDTPTIPEDPDSLLDPKTALLELASRSTNREIRKGMVPAPGDTSPVGRRYNLLLTRFARVDWRPDRAAQNSPSLRKCLAALRDLGRNG